jgi:glucose-1-phosphate cytidylyltransferase
MKTIILAGGLGTRLSEETLVRPKPMVEIGGQPILLHIMRTYAHHGFKEFIVALGYKGEMIKDYFLRFKAMSSNLSVDLGTGDVRVHGGHVFDWRVHLVDTGLETMTGGRVKRLTSWLGNDDTFMLTYGDAVADINIAELVDFHHRHGKLATVTAVRPPARFGSIVFEGDRVASFAEKPQVGEGWINGGFLVLDRKVLDFIHEDNDVWERGPMERLTAEGQLMAFRHDGFWQPMDTLREKNLLEDYWQSGAAPWKVW